MVTHYSKNIQNIIQKELFLAQKSIKIAVAWFTNNLLYQPLLLKLQTGVVVEIILNQDEINDSKENEIDFLKFLELGGILRWNTTKQLLHDKFCIIDDNIVIAGSYNWTNKAEYNEETVTKFVDDACTINFYSKKFATLSKKHKKVQVPNHKPVSIENSNLSFFEIVKSEFDTNRISQLKIQPVDYASYENIAPAFTAMNKIKPIKRKEYPELNFYPSIEHFPILRVWECAEKVGRFALLDNNFYPLTNCVFEDVYKSPNNDVVWLKSNEKWAAYSITNKLQYTPELKILDESLLKSDNQFIPVIKGISTGFWDVWNSSWYDVPFSSVEIRTKGCFILISGIKYGYINLCTGLYIPCKYTRKQINDHIHNN